MRIMVTGGRDYADRDHVFEVLDSLHGPTDGPRSITELLHGACGWDADRGNTWLMPIQGADGHADAWAIARHVRVARVPAHWTSQGKRGGPFRNEAMVLTRPALVVAFPGGAGTQNAITLAHKHHVRVEKHFAGAPACPFQVHMDGGSFVCVLEKGHPGEKSPLGGHHVVRATLVDEVLQLRSNNGVRT